MLIGIGFLLFMNVNLIAFLNLSGRFALSYI